MYRPHTICRLAGHRLPELLTFCSLRIFLSFVKIYDNVGAGKSQEIGKKREKRSNTGENRKSFGMIGNISDEEGGGNEFFRPADGQKRKRNKNLRKQGVFLFLTVGK